MAVFKLHGVALDRSMYVPDNVSFPGADRGPKKRPLSTQTASFGAELAPSCALWHYKKNSRPPLTQQNWGAQNNMQYP